MQREQSEEEINPGLRFDASAAARDAEIPVVIFRGLVLKQHCCRSITADDGDEVRHQVEARNNLFRDVCDMSRRVS